MRSFTLRLGVAGVAFAGLCGFEDPKVPPDYSPHYTTIEVVRPNGKVKRVLAPEACLSEVEEPSAAVIGEHLLPPGCANTYNLQRMVERKKDLVRGRLLSETPMTTTETAAKRYLEGPAYPPEPVGAPSVSSK